MTILKFNSQDVLTLVNYAKSCAQNNPCFEHLTTTKYLKPGCKLDKHGFAKTGDVDKSKIPPHLILVKDAGIYLMSSGFPD